MRYQYSKYRVDLFLVSVCTHLNVPDLDYTRIWQKNYVDSYQGWLKISEDRTKINDYYNKNEQMLTPELSTRTPIDSSILLVKEGYLLF